MAEREASQTLMVRWCPTCKMHHEGMLVGVIEWVIPPWCREEHPEGWLSPRVAELERELASRDTMPDAPARSASFPGEAKTEVFPWG